MLLISIVIITLMIALEVADSSRVDRPISLDMSSGNWLAWLLILALCVFVVVFGRRLLRNGHRISIAPVLIVVFGLIIITVSGLEFRVNEIILWTLAMLTVLWFIIMAVQYESSEIAYAAASCFVALPLLALYGVGFAERALILYSVTICNILYYRYMGPNGKTTW